MDVNRQSVRLVMVSSPIPSLEGKRVILASASPRRRELLAMLGIDFDVAAPRDVDESYPADLAPTEVPEYLSRKKADAYRPTLGADDVLITADTVVIVGDEVLGKPRDAADAAAMLRLLSGRGHQVVTGVTVASLSRTVSFRAITEVQFAPLTEREITYYIERYRPFDKAGAYGIQEWIGCIGIKGIQGSFYNVMGLPLHRLYATLNDF